MIVVMGMTVMRMKRTRAGAVTSLQIKKTTLRGHFISPASLNGETSVPSMMRTRGTERGSGQRCLLTSPERRPPPLPHPGLADPRMDVLFPPASHGTAWTQLRSIWATNGTSPNKC